VRLINQHNPDLDPSAQREPNRFERSPLWQLTWTRILGFLREPEAVFWVFAFPVLMSLALGIAFRNPGSQPSKVGIETGPRAPELSRALAGSSDLNVITLEPDEARLALRRGRIAVLVRADEGRAPILVYDATRPETRLAQQLVTETLERAAGRVNRLQIQQQTVMLPGSRYIDFLIPGLIGLNLLGTGMWGIGFPIATARQQKLLKRMIASPMRKTDYLLSLLLARLVWLVLEVVAIVGFGWIAFGTIVRGSWIGFVSITLVGALAFSALGLLVASRARTIEAVSGWMNVVMLPMWLLSGSFFSADRFPALWQPAIQALPLTLTNNALRAIMNEGASLNAVAGPLAALTAWGLGGFLAALLWFRWE
jgi:ABC-2 type transport system permease protein